VTASPSVDRRSRWRSLVPFCTWGYFTVVLIGWFVMAVAGDRWWVGTILLFGPRWLWAVPLPLLVGAAVAVRKLADWRITTPLVLAVLLVAGPVTGLCLPLFAASSGSQPQHLRIRVLSCNTGGGGLNPGALERLIVETWPDVVALQEWTPPKETSLFSHADWRVHSGAGRCVASRFPMEGIKAIRDPEGWHDLVVCCNLLTPQGRVRFCNVHLPTPRPGLELLLEGRWNGMDELDAVNAHRWRASAVAREFIAHSPAPLLVAGDFNTPADSPLYRTNWSDLSNAYTSAGFGWGATKHTRWVGVRIDHVLAGPGWGWERCWVGPDVGSDHRPVIADAVWVGVPGE
jgi:vancomycin resistance protein VanJ